MMAFGFFMSSKNTLKNAICDDAQDWLAIMIYFINFW